MKALILTAGFATRLYPLTKNRPRSLLTIRNKPIIEHIINKLESLAQIDEILIITNQKFLRQFQDWVDEFPSIKPLKLIDNGITSEKDRLGAIGDIVLVIKEEKIDEDLLVIADDNLFSFNLRNFIEFALKLRPSSCIGIYDLNGTSNPNPFRNQRFLSEANKFRVVQLNGDKEIIDFQEKPTQPKSSLIAMGIYFFPKERLRLISEYLSQNNNHDAPGQYISWLAKLDKVYGYAFEGDWRDISDKDAYTDAVFTF